MGEGSWGWTNPDYTPQAESAPGGPTGRQVRLVLVATLLIAAALLAYTVLGADNGGKGSALNPIAQAAEKTAHYPGERMRMTGSFTAPGSPVTLQLHGSGAYNGTTQRGRFDMTIDNLLPTGSFTMKEVVDEDGFYIGSPQFAGRLPAGKTWVRLDASSDDATGSAISQGDPRQQLEALESVSNAIATVGTESIDGHRTTHYSAQIGVDKEVDQMRAAGDDKAADDLEQIAEQTGIANIPVEAWIDDRGLLRRMAMTVPVPNDLGRQINLNLDMYFFDFGGHPSIETPPPARVYETSTFDLDALTQ